MTVKEKRAKVYYHCFSSDCKNCVLRDKKISESAVSCIRTAEATESELDKAIEYIEGTRGEENEPSNDPVNRPAHYTDGKIEVIEFIEDKNLGFCLGNAVKYIARAGKKDPTKEIEDLNKAKWYIERRIKELKEASA